MAVKKSKKLRIKAVEKYKHDQTVLDNRCSPSNSSNGYYIKSVRSLTATPDNSLIKNRKLLHTSIDEAFDRKINLVLADTGAKKNDSGKLPIDLIPVHPLLDLAAVLQHGMVKYDANNWRKGFLFSRTYAAAMRHMLAWYGGEDNDPDSGISHLMHAACNLFFLSEFMHTHPELDDRIKSND